MVMNLKETLISSFFFHLILFLLMIALSHYTTGLSGDIQNIISIDLAMEESKDQPAAQSDSEDDQPLESSLSSEDAMSLPEQAVSKQPEEAAKIQEPEKKAEAARPSIQREGFTSPEAYYQFILLHRKVFAQQAGARVNELLGEAFKTNTRQFYGGTAIVSLTFGPDGQLNEVAVDSASPALKAFFEEIGWGIVPAPAVYSLGYSTVQIEFAVMEGYMSFNINPR